MKPPCWLNRILFDTSMGCPQMQGDFAWNFASINPAGLKTTGDRGWLYYKLNSWDLTSGDLRVKNCMAAILGRITPAIQIKFPSPRIINKSYNRVPFWANDKVLRTKVSNMSINPVFSKLFFSITEKPGKCYSEWEIRDSVLTEYAQMMIVGWL